MNKSDREKLTRFYKQSAKRCRKSELPMLKRSFSCHFLESSLNENERWAHQTLKWQIIPGRLQQHIVVPEDIAEKDARKALRLLKLEHDPEWSFQVTWKSHLKKTPKP